MSKVVGIDLGTTNSLVAYVKDGRPEVIRDKSGDALVPSVVSAAAEGTIYVGREAQRRLLTEAARTVYSVKRFMGRGIDDVRDESRLMPFRVAGEANGVVRIGLGEREFTPPEISAFILRDLKHRAEEFFAAQEGQNLVGDFLGEAHLLLGPAQLIQIEIELGEIVVKDGGHVVVGALRRPQFECLSIESLRRRVMASLEMNERQVVEARTEILGVSQLAA